MARTVAPPTDLLTIAEAAGRLRCSPKTIRRRIADGALPALRLPPGRSVRVVAADVDALLRPIPSAAA